MEHIAEVFPTAGKAWTAGEPLPGGNLPGQDFDRFVADLSSRWPDMPSKLLRRLARAYGTEAIQILGAASVPADLGEDFGAGLHAAEIEYLFAAEWARTAEDILYRRSKLGLHVPPGTETEIDAYLSTLSRCVASL